RNRHGSAATEKRSAVISSGENSLSARRLAIKPNPQMTATRTAMHTSAGFTFLALLFGLVDGGRYLSALFAGFRFAQQISAVQRGMVVDRLQRESDIGQHAFDDPAEGRVFVPHMADDALAL